MESSAKTDPALIESTQPRRSFLAVTSTIAMAGGLAAGYGTFFALAGRFLYPAAEQPKGWQFVARTGELRMGDAVNFITPAGARVVVARQRVGDAPEDFIALSSVCPHLGCAVHWEPHNARFFCPCHNGVFDPQGKAVSGPPADGGQDLPRFPLRIESGMLFMETPLETISIQHAAIEPAARRGVDRGGASWA